MSQQNELLDCDESLIDSVLTAATRVHQTLGPGLLESVYELALMKELSINGVSVKHQVPVPAFYRGEELGLGFRADIIVENSLLLELKCVEQLSGIHLAQVMTYLKLLKFKRGFLLNFSQPLMKNGIKRVSI